MTKIDPARWYDLSSMFKELKPFTWLKSYQGYRNVVVSDALGDNILRARIYGEGRNRRYQIKGSNLLTYLAARKKSGK